MAFLGQILLRYQKPEGSDEHASGKGSAPPQPASENGEGERKKNGIGEQKKNGEGERKKNGIGEQKKNGKGEQKTNGNKKKKGKGKADVFNIQGNKFDAGSGQATKSGVFDFNNTYTGHKVYESSDEEGDSCDEEAG